MTVTFLVAVRLTDLSTLTDYASDIEDDLVTAGHDVVSVKPWARPTANPLAALPTLTETTQQQTTTPEIQQ
jgi:hypothetical protein